MFTLFRIFGAVLLWMRLRDKSTHQTHWASHITSTWLRSRICYSQCVNVRQKQQQTSNSLHFTFNMFTFFRNCRPVQIHACLKVRGSFLKLPAPQLCSICRCLSLSIDFRFYTFFRDQSWRKTLWTSHAFMVVYVSQSHNSLLHCSSNSLDLAFIQNVNVCLVCLKETCSHSSTFCLYKWYVESFIKLTGHAFTYFHSIYMCIDLSSWCVSNRQEKTMWHPRAISFDVETVPAKGAKSMRLEIAGWCW